MKRTLFGATALALVLGLSVAAAQERQRNEMPAAQPNAQSQQPASQQQGSQVPIGTTGQAPRDQQEPKRDQPPSAQQSQQPAQQQNATEPSRGEQKQDVQRPATQQQSQQPAAKQDAQRPDSKQDAQRPDSKQDAQRPDRKQDAQAPAPRQQQTGQNQTSSGQAASKLDDQQRTRISQRIASVNVQPMRNVNFSLSIGTMVPRSVRLHPLPRDIVSIVPHYRGYSFVLVEDEIVIIEPRSYRIVEVIKTSGGRSAGVSRKKISLTQKQRDAVRTQITRRPAAPATTGEATRTEIVVGERLPETIVIERFPDTVYRQVPALRSYNYVVRDRDIYLVEPRERRVIEMMD